MINSYEKKYNSRNPLLPIKSLTYFSDINFDEPIQLIDGNLEWQVISDRILDMVDKPAKTFPVLNFQGGAGFFCFTQKKRIQTR